ncbi:MAG: hypothetical protein UF067_05795, partial [Paludibacteraceae bacterium]|nr:hypothetical protein [Paludibacteraceae bacterium]
FGGKQYSEAGDYQHTFKSQNGCDSVVYLHLVVEEEVEEPQEPSENASCPWGSPNDVVVFCTDENPLGITYDAMRKRTDVADFGECKSNSELIDRAYFTLDEAMFLDSVKKVRELGYCNFYCYRDNYRDRVEEIYAKAPTYKTCQYKVTGCLGKVAYPSWFAFQVEDGGELAIKINHSEDEDIDFACWGPFQGDSKGEMLNKVCSEDLLDDGKLHKTSPTVDWDITKPDFRKDWNYPYGNLQDCSYSTSHTEYCYLPNVKKGEWYILMISNFAEHSGDITFNKFSGSATTDCSKIIDLTSNSPVCEGEDLKLKVLNAPVHATFKWTGPDGFESTERNPVLKNASASASGTYYLTLTNNGVSSDPTPIDVTVYPTNTYDTVTIKQGEAYTFGGKAYSEAGDYQHTFKSQNGCDSVVNLHLVVKAELPTVTLTAESPVCEGEPLEIIAQGVPSDAAVILTTPSGSTVTKLPYTVKSAQKTDGGKYILSVTLSDGTKLQSEEASVTVNPSYKIKDTVTIKHGEAYTFGGKAYSDAGDYQHTFKSQNGCDSVVNLHLAVKAELPTITMTAESPVCEGEPLEIIAQGVPSDASVILTTPSGATLTKLPYT